ncbi:MAG: SPOR domain-containing protein [Bacteroidia bacterium]|nr:SPOR domain-containing protein [Bacteroidia bacterium]
MKILSKILLLSVFSMFCFTTIAQTQKQRKEIIDELNTIKPGQGRVMVFEDKAIEEVLGRSMAPARTVYATADGVQFVRMRGFKIQAFSGNNQRTSKNEAYHKQGLINTSFPGQETVVTFDSPFWRLRVGNFKTREDATAMLNEMRRTFPAFGREMYVVIDEVKIPVAQLQE